MLLFEMLLTVIDNPERMNERTYIRLYYSLYDYYKKNSNLINSK